MLPAIAASAAAARAVGYVGLAELIEAEQLTPQRIAALFRISASRYRGRDCAVILLAGALARFRACPHGWDGEDERQLALEALAGDPNPAAAVAKLSEQAIKIVDRHWQAIARAA